MRAVRAALIDRGWRRSGGYMYVPLNGKTCCPLHTIRLDVAAATLSKAQRRVLRRMNRFLAGDDPRAAAEAPSPAAAPPRPVDAVAVMLHTRIVAAATAADAAAAGALLHGGALGTFSVRPRVHAYHAAAAAAAVVAAAAAEVAAAHAHMGAHSRPCAHTRARATRAGGALSRGEWPG